MSNTLEFDLRNRWTPSINQISAAVELLQHYSGMDISVIVPIALNYKEYGFWNDGVEVAPIDGIYLLAAHDVADAITSAIPYADARSIAEKIARDYSIEGTGSYAVIDADGTWSVWEVI